MLYVFDQQEKTLIMIDPRPVEEWCKDTQRLCVPNTLLDLATTTRSQLINIFLDGMRMFSNGNLNGQKTLQMM